MQNVKNYKKITLAEVLGDKAFTHVDNATEFLFLYAIKRELEEEGYTIDLGELEYHQHVFNNEYFAVVAKRDADVRALTDIHSLAQSARVDTKVFIGTVKGVKFDLVNEGDYSQLVFSETKYEENMAVRGTGDTSVRYIYLCARAFVYSAINGSILKTFVIDNLKGQGNGDNYSLLPILQFYGAKPLAHILDVYPQEKDDRKSAASYRRLAVLAFDYYLKQKEVPEEQYPIEEKYAYLKEHYRVGSVVHFYNFDTAKLLVQGNCIAVILDIQPTFIRVRKVRRFSTRLGTEIEYEKYNKRQRDVYGDKAAVFTLENLHGTEYLYSDETYSLYELGVDLMISVRKTGKETSTVFSAEPYYIREVDGAEIVPVTLYTNSDTWDYETLQLDTYEATYAVLADWGVDFDAIDYRTRYMKDGKEPVYEKYRQHNRDQQLKK